MNGKLPSLRRFDYVVLALFLLSWLLGRHVYPFPSVPLYPVTAADLQWVRAHPLPPGPWGDDFWEFAALFLAAVNAAAVCANVLGLHRAFFAKAPVFSLSRRQRACLLLLVGLLWLLPFLWVRLWAEHFSVYMHLTSGAALSAAFLLSLHLWGGRQVH